MCCRKNIKNWYTRKKNAQKLKELIKAERRKDKLCRKITNLTETVQLAELIKRFEDEQNREFGEEISDETGHGQNLDRSPYRQYKNPFKKFIICRQIKSENKQSQLKREADVLQHPQDIESIIAELDEDISHETGYGQNLGNLYTPYKNPFKIFVNNRQIKAEKKKRRKREEMRQQLQDKEFKKVDLRLRHEKEFEIIKMEKENENRYENKKNNSLFKKSKHKKINKLRSDDISFENYVPPNEEQITETKIVRTKPEYEKKPMAKYYGTRSDFELNESKEVKNIKKVQKTKLKRKIKPSPKHKNLPFDDDDKMYDAETKKEVKILNPKLTEQSSIIYDCKNNKCKNTYCIKKLFDYECNNTRKLARNEVLCKHLQLIKGELSEEINHATDYGQNLSRDSNRQYTNPFKKFITKRRNKAEKKRAQPIKELKRLQHLQDVESKRTDFGEEINHEMDYGLKLSIRPSKEYKYPSKKFDINEPIKKAENNHQIITEPEFQKNTKRKESKKRYTQQQSIFKKPKYKQVMKSEDSDSGIELNTYAPIKEQQIIKPKVERSTPEHKQKSCTEDCDTKGDYEISEPKREDNITKVKQTKVKQPLPKRTSQLYYSDDEMDDKMDDEIIKETVDYKPCNNMKCRNLYCVKKRHDFKSDDRSKLTRNETQLLKRRTTLAPNKRYFKIFNETIIPLLS